MWVFAAFFSRSISTLMSNALKMHMRIGYLLHCLLLFDTFLKIHAFFEALTSILSGSIFLNYIHSEKDTCQRFTWKIWYGLIYGFDLLLKYVNSSSERQLSALLWKRHRTGRNFISISCIFQLLSNSLLHQMFSWEHLAKFSRWTKCSIKKYYFFSREFVPFLHLNTFVSPKKNSMRKFREIFLWKHLVK